MDALLTFLKNILTSLDPQLTNIAFKIRTKSPSIYAVIVAILTGVNTWMYEATKAGTLHLNQTGLVIGWAVSFLLLIFMRPSIGDYNDTGNAKQDPIKIEKPSDIKY